MMKNLFFMFFSVFALAGPGFSERAFGGAKEGAEAKMSRVAGFLKKGDIAGAEKVLRKMRAEIRADKKDGIKRINVWPQL